MTTRNVRLLTINPMMVRVVEALIKKKLEPLVEDNSFRAKYMGKGQVGFIPGTETDLHIYRLLKRIKLKQE